MVIGLFLLGSRFKEDRLISIFIKDCCFGEQARSVAILQLLSSTSKLGSYFPDQIKDSALKTAIDEKLITQAIKERKIKFPVQSWDRHEGAEEHPRKNR